MSGSVPGGVKAEPNLTPILDMVFQLITFFMLVINFKAAELDQTLKLPIIGSARPVPLGTQKEFLVLNVKDVGGKAAVSVYGRVIDEDHIKGYLNEEAKVSLKAAKLTSEDIASGTKELPETVVIRADKDCPFHHVNYVVMSCQAIGYRKFAYKAYSAPPKTNQP